MPIKVLLFVSLIFSLSFASFSSDLDTLAKKMAIALKLSPEQPLVVTTINADKNYLLPLDPLLLQLKEKLAPYAKEVSFNPFRGEENAIIRSLIRSGGADYAPVRMEEKKIDSLILSGYYDLFTNTKDTAHVTYHIKIIDQDARVLFESEEYTIGINDCPAAIQREVFGPISNSDKFQEMEYKGNSNKEMDDLFNHTPNNNLLVQPAEYRFENNNPYAIQWQVEWLRDLLTRNYYITWNDTSKNSITIEQSGSVVFSRGGRQYVRSKLIDGEHLLPDSFPEERNTYHYITRSTTPAGAEQPVVESRTSTEKEEITIQDRIRQTFDSLYPELFNHFNYAKLDSIYIDQGHPSILIGTKVLDDPATGREAIKYAWYNKKEWLNNLRAKVEKENRRFKVKTSVMGIFNDNLDRNRYWAVVKQKWETHDFSGNVVYQDDGFLIVNFDFDADQQLRDFKIYYRLWFYDYQYDDLERHIKRHEKLLGDIKRYFTEGDSFGGIDSSLKQGIMEFLINKVKTANSGLITRK